MPTTANQNPEQIARDKIDAMLAASGWVVQDKDRINWGAGNGIAVREYQTDVGPADYVLFVNRKPVGIIEAKREDEGQRLLMVEEQSVGYARAQLRHLNNDPLPYVYESTGTLTRFTDYNDPIPRGRRVFSFHRPETMIDWGRKEKSLRGRFQDLPALNHEGLRKAQITAIENLEQSFKNNRPRALIQMATGAGKTFTAATFIYRLLKHANAKRVLFLVDTKNLGEQAEQEFMKFQPKDDNRKFTELYNVHRLSSSYVPSDSQVCISTIQRMYSILQGEDLDESAEEANPHESTWMQEQINKKDPAAVAYNDQVPLEMFDFIVIDECHRSIYNLWMQVLDYYDAFLIGLTATPDKRTFGFFNENVVSEYTYEESVADGVNVPYDVYTIKTDISTEGGKVEAGWFVSRRDKLTRAQRWQREDEDTEFTRSDLDRNVVVVSQIRTIIKEFKQALRTTIYPNRFNADGTYEVPKTLIFAKTDSHADDIIRIVREEFDAGNDFCKKVTYKIDEDPKSLLNRFRNSYYPRIAVTVDMIATGTDVKPLEVLLFMRDVKSINYFEQMKGRGTRTIHDDQLKEVSSTAKEKTHFVIVDAVGAVKSKKTDSRPLERKRGIPLKDLLGAALMGVADEDLFLSLANRLIRLDKQIDVGEREKAMELAGGKDLKQITRELLGAFDPDAVEALTQSKADDTPEEERTPERMKQWRDEAQTELALQASSTFNGELNEYLDNVRRIHEQIIDNINLDTVTHSGWDKEATDRSKALVQEFEEYLTANKDEIVALSIFFNQPQQRRDITFKMIKDVATKLKASKPTLAPLKVWEAYTALEEVKGERPESELTALVSLIRGVCGMDEQLTNYKSIVDRNFQAWTFKKQEGKEVKFTKEQMEWLRMLKDHMANSFHVQVDDLDYTPFDTKGGRGGMHALFGDDMDGLLEELNEALVA